MNNSAGRVRLQRLSDEANFDIKFFKRFWKISGLLFPSLKKPASWLALFLLLLCLLEQVVIYYIGLVPSEFYKILNEKDEASFYPHLLKAVGLILVEAFVLSTKTYVASFLYLTWRESICLTLHEQYFLDILYYKLNVVHKTIDNPDQRITQDVDRMCNTFSQVLIPLIISPFTIGYYIYQAWNVTGYLGPVSTVVFFIFFTIINKVLMSPVSKWFYKQEKQEGDFRYKHMQIRMNSESAAFYRAGTVEKNKTNAKFRALLRTQHRLIRWQYVLQWCINSADYLGSILSYVAIAFPIFAGSYDDLSPADLSALISKNSFVNIYLISCFTKLIDQSARMTDVVGSAHRISQLFEELGRLRDLQNENYSFLFPQCNDERPHHDTETRFSLPKRSAFTLEDVTYGLPKSSKILCRNLTFQLECETNVLITGDSGCGKSSLLRVLSGLWQSASGNLVTQVRLGPKGIIYLPQKPYFTNGTLREQIIYPLQEGEVVPDDGKIHEYLHLVGLNNLLDRLGGLDVDDEWNWYDEMSPGEMQRLSFVRLFIHHPPYAVLDEATSQVSQSMEELLYKTCQELGITYLSIGHRSTVRAFHQLELHLDGQGGWSLEPLSDNSIN